MSMNHFPRFKSSNIISYSMSAIVVKWVHIQYILHAFMPKNNNIMADLLRQLSYSAGSKTVPLLSVHCSTYRMNLIGFFLFFFKDFGEVCKTRAPVATLLPPQPIAPVAYHQNTEQMRPRANPPAVPRFHSHSRGGRRRSKALTIFFVHFRPGSSWSLWS